MLMFIFNNNSFVSYLGVKSKEREENNFLLLIHRNRLTSIVCKLIKTKQIDNTYYN